MTSLRVFQWSLKHLVSLQVLVSIVIVTVPQSIIGFLSLELFWESNQTIVRGSVAFEHQTIWVSSWWNALQQFWKRDLQQFASDEIPRVSKLVSQVSSVGGIRTHDCHFIEKKIFTMWMHWQCGNKINARARAPDPNQPNDEPTQRQNNPATKQPSDEPTQWRTNPATNQPNDEPTQRRTNPAKNQPSDEPTHQRTNPEQPIDKPTQRRTNPTTNQPNEKPTQQKTDPEQPNDEPTKRQTNPTTNQPSDKPTQWQTNPATEQPNEEPAQRRTNLATMQPSDKTTQRQTNSTTNQHEPTQRQTNPATKTKQPSDKPTQRQTNPATKQPRDKPTQWRTNPMTNQPIDKPTQRQNNQMKNEMRDLTPTKHANNQPQQLDQWADPGFVVMSKAWWQQANKSWKSRRKLLTPPSLWTADIWSNCSLLPPTAQMPKQWHAHHGCWWERITFMPARTCFNVWFTSHASPEEFTNCNPFLNWLTIAKMLMNMNLFIWLQNNRFTIIVMFVNPFLMLLSNGSQWVHKIGSWFVSSSAKGLQQNWFTKWTMNVNRFSQMGSWMIGSQTIGSQIIWLPISAAPRCGKFQRVDGHVSAVGSLWSHMSGCCWPDRNWSLRTSGEHHLVLHRWRIWHMVQRLRWKQQFLWFLLSGNTVEQRRFQKMHLTFFSSLWHWIVTLSCAALNVAGRLSCLHQKQMSCWAQNEPRPNVALISERLGSRSLSTMIFLLTWTMLLREELACLLWTLSFNWERPALQRWLVLHQTEQHVFWSFCDGQFRQNRTNFTNFTNSQTHKLLCKLTNFANLQTLQTSQTSLCCACVCLTSSVVMCLFLSWETFFTGSEQHARTNWSHDTEERQFREWIPEGSPVWGRSLLCPIWGVAVFCSTSSHFFLSCLPPKGKDPPHVASKDLPFSFVAFLLDLHPKEQFKGHCMASTVCIFSRSKMLQNRLHKWIPSKASQCLLMLAMFVDACHVCWCSHQLGDPQSVRFLFSSSSLDRDFFWLDGETLQTRAHL